LAAGVTWTLVIASAPWAARRAHTSVIDAAGTIYIIGGIGLGDTYFNDVWASTDGGARPDSVRGVRGGTTGVTGVLGCTIRVSRCSIGLGYLMGIRWVLEGFSRVPRAF
jgi:hypothetical protein